MRLINTRAHGIYDYVLALILLDSPAIFHFENNGPAYTCMVITAALILLTALLTKYEAGLFKIIPIRLHFWMDCLNGAALSLAPWIFGFHPLVYKPHLVFGLSLIVVSLLTDRLPAYYVRQLMGRGRKTEAGKQPDRFDKGLHFIYTSSEELLLKLLRKNIRH